MDFLVDQSKNESLRLIRYIAEQGKGTAGVVYIFPINLQSEQISLQTIRLVLSELEEREYIEILQKPNYNLTDEQRLRRDDEGDYYFIEVFESFYDYAKAKELTADDFSPTTSTTASKGNELIADLSFSGMTVPTVKIADSIIKYPSMRLGTPFYIVSYCLENRPDQTLSLDVLKAELKAKGMPAHGLSNIKESLRNSFFGVEKPLGVFVVVSPKGIMVKPSVLLSKPQLEAIIAASKKK